MSISKEKTRGMVEFYGLERTSNRRRNKGGHHPILPPPPVRCFDAVAIGLVGEAAVVDCTGL